MDRRTLLFSALATGVTGALPRSALAAEAFAPPLWMVRRGRAKVYLFGEMFAGKDYGPSPAVVAAFNESAEYWRETPRLNPQDQALMTRLGQAETPVTERLSAADAKRLLAAAATINVAPETFQLYRPWLVVQRLQGPLLRSLGVAMQQDAGVTAAAQASNKALRYEFADGQAVLRYFADMPPDAEVEYLLSFLANFEAGGEWWARRAEAWAVGDLSIEEVLAQRQARELPAYYEYLDAARNRAWVPQFRTMLEGDVASFVRVGSGHLGGPSSIQRQLARAGLTLERVS